MALPPLFGVVHESAIWEFPAVAEKLPGTAGAVAVTANFASIAAEVLLEVVMVMVGLYVPTASPESGCTVKVLVAPGANAVLQPDPAERV